MTINEKIKTISNKTEQNKAQYDLGRQTAKISALSPGIISNTNVAWMIGKDVLTEKDLLEKAVAIKRFEYYSLGKELEKQTSVVEKQYQKFDNDIEFDKTIEEQKPTLKKYVRWNLIYDSKYNFYP